MTLAVLRRPKPKPRFHQVTRRVADRLAPQLSGAWEELWILLASGIDPVELRNALAGGNASWVEMVMGPARLPSMIESDPRLVQLLHRISSQVASAGQVILADTIGGPPVTLEELHFLLEARQQVRDQAVYSREGLTQGIRAVLQLGRDWGLAPESMARAVESVLGLPPTWAGAPTRFARELRRGVVNKSRLLHRPLLHASPGARGWVAEVEAGVRDGKHHDPTWVLEQQVRYAQALQRRQSLTVSRTLAMRAANFGQREVWRTAVREGVLPWGVKRYWVVTPDERLSYEHSLIPSMNLQGRALDEPFQTPRGEFMEPPIRPNCRCGVALKIPGRPGVL